MLIFALCCLPLICFGQQQHASLVDAQAADFKRRGAEAFAGIKALNKEDICRKAVSTVDMLDCLGKGSSRATRMYKAYVLAVGGLIRLDMADQGAGPERKSTGRLSFDEGETAWLRYQDQTCSQQFDLAHGGTLAPVEATSCALTLTIAHVRELDRFYSGLFQ